MPIGLGIAALLGYPLEEADGSTATSSMSVTATVQATCTISTTTMAFGTYSGTAVSSTATVTITCTNTSPYTVGLNAGTGTSPTATVTARPGPGGALLNYNVYRDSARSQMWGNTVGTDEVTGTGSGSNQSLTAYARIHANQFVTPGSYSDTVTATINY